MNANGEMLRLARQLRGFPQTEAASRIGIERSLLSRCENGLCEIREEVLKRAVAAYDLPRTFFFVREAVYGSPVSVHPMWRKKADVSSRERDAIVAELNLRVMHLRQLLEGAEFACTSEIPRLDIEEFQDPERIAALVRAHWKIPRGPVKNLTVLVERAGAIVVHSPLGGGSISGVTFSAPGVPPLIVLNSDQPSDRMRFTLAHELGHLVMHRFPTSNMEQEANEFASALLMPAADIRPYFVGRRIDLALLAALKPEWKVAMQALLMRASGLDAITKNQSQYLWKQISARGYRLREPPELEFEPEKPTVLDGLLRVHLTALGYSQSELSSLFHLHESDFVSLYGTSQTRPNRPKLTVVK